MDAIVPKELDELEVDIGVLLNRTTEVAELQLDARWNPPARRL